MPSHAADSRLLLAIVALTIFGFVVVGSASAVVGEQFKDDPFFFLKHQVTYGGSVGLLLFLIGFFIPYRQWIMLAFPGLVVSLGLLCLVFLPSLQVASGGSVRWIALGPITIQPSEVVKLAFIMYLAALLEKKGEDIHDFRKSGIPFLVITALITILISLQPDIGTLFTITAIALMMIWTAGFRMRHLAGIVAIGTAVFAILVSTARYRLARVFVYLHPELDPQGIGYQINQALLAVGTGGLWGLGFGRSRQKYHYLPEPASDSIFAVMAEELGLFRILLIFGAFWLTAYQGYRVARNIPDTFGRLLAVGITSWITVQAFVNIGSILGLVPLTGIPLPFISYGGSSLATLLFAGGVLLNISKYTEESR